MRPSWEREMFVLLSLYIRPHSSCRRGITHRSLMSKRNVGVINRDGWEKSAKLQFTRVTAVYTCSRADMERYLFAFAKVVCISSCRFITQGCCRGWHTRRSPLPCLLHNVETAAWGCVHDTAVGATYIAAHVVQYGPMKYPWVSSGRFSKTVGKVREIVHITR